MRAGVGTAAGSLYVPGQPQFAIEVEVSVIIKVRQALAIWGEVGLAAEEGYGSNSSRSSSESEASATGSPITIWNMPC